MSSREQEDYGLSSLPIIQLVETLIDTAHSLRASDIHIDPQEHSIRIRFRIDGILEDFTPLPKHIHNEVISRIKILSGLRTDEHQAAQDGRWRHSLNASESHADIRVSIHPHFTEKMLLYEFYQTPSKISH
jgi:type II secretory ATPase GspE/PulE/Tfp pilus assembly ATPase PilB-like protein